MEYQIEFEQEDDGRRIAEIPTLPGVMAYGVSKDDAESKVEAVTLRVIADRIEPRLEAYSQERIAKVSRA